MPFKLERGFVAVGTILMAFTICGLIMTGASVYTHIEEEMEMEVVVKMIKDNASTLKKYHGDDPKAYAQAEAWERMAQAIEGHEELVYSQKMFEEAVSLGINLVPGRLPFKEGTQQAIELIKDIYDTHAGLGEAYKDEPEEPSEEMKGFLKAIAKGKIDADALEIVMLKVREQALSRQLEKLEEDIAAEEKWQTEQQERLQNYRQMFTENVLKKLKETGQLPSYYKRRWQKEGLPDDLAQYPEIVEAFNQPDEPGEELRPISEEEKEEVDEMVHQLVSQSEELEQVLEESLAEEKQGDDQKDVAELVKKLEEIVLEKAELEEKIEEQMEAKEEEESFFDGIKKIWRGGTHNSFSFESDGSGIKYEAVRYDGWSIGKGSIDNVQPNSFVSYTGSLFNQHNTAIVVYVSTDGNLYYKVIDPYAVSGKERSYIGTIHSGILGRDVGSIDVSKLKVVRRGKYGLEVRWTDNQGETYQAEINQFHGAVKKEKVADKSSATGQVTAVGRVLPCPDYDTKGPCKGDLEYLERMKQDQYGGSMVCLGVTEDENYFEMTFPREGGAALGSLSWQFTNTLQTKGTDDVGLNINRWEGSITGNYSGGKKGKFEGKVEGSHTFTYVHRYEGSETSNGEPSRGSFEGTWTAKMSSNGKIEGTLHYTSSMPTGQRYEDWLDFQATVE